jgi:hypothetical protein
MVEDEGQAPVARIGDDGGLGVVGAPRIAPGPGQEDCRDRMEARVPCRVGVGAELGDEFDIEGRFLAGLADGGRLEGLAVIDEAARQGPAGRRVLPLNEDNAAPPAAVHDLDDDVDGRERIAELGVGRHEAWISGAIVGPGPDGCQFGDEEP